MPYPPLLPLATEAAYRAVFEAKYCKGPIITHDGISVRFKKDDFDHCFFESTKRNRVKDKFSPARAERVLWIEAALQDPTALMVQGWNRDLRKYEPDRRVTIAMGNYLVVIGLSSATTARFISAYVADVDTMAKIRASPPPP